MSKLSTAILTVLSFCILSYCEYNDEKAIDIEVASTLKLPLPNKSNPVSRAIQYRNIESHEKLHYLDSYANRILTFDLDKQQLSKEIEFDLDGPFRVGDLRGFYYENDEKIYLTSKSKPSVTLAKIDGKPYDNFIYNEHENYTGSFYAQTVNQLVLLDSLIFLKQSPPSPYSQLSIEQFANSPLGLRVNIKNRKVTSYKANYPNEYWQRYHFSPYSSTTFNGQEIIYSFWYSNVLYAYNIATEEIKRIDLSEYIPAFTYKKVSSPTESMSHLIRNESINSIAFDRFRKVYYLFYYPGDKDLNTNEYDLYALAYNKPHLILYVLDDKFKLIAKKRMKSFTYKIDNYFISKKGLFLSRNNELNTAMDENLLQFDLLKVK